MENSTTSQDNNSLVTANSTSSAYDAHPEKQDIYFVILKYCSAILLVFGIITNVFTVVTIFCQKSLRVTPNIFIASMCFNNLLYLLGVVFPGVFNFFSDYHSFTTASCKVYICFRWSVMSASIFNLCAIAVNRYLAVVHSQKRRYLVGPWAVTIQIFIVYFAASVGFTPMYVKVSQHIVYIPFLYDCRIMRGQVPMLLTLMFLSKAIFPLILLLFCYTRIYIESCLSKRRLMDINQAMSSQNKSLRRNLDLSYSMGYLTLAYLITITIPYILSRLIQKDWRQLLYIPLYSGFGINPVVYALKQKKFREIYAAKTRRLYEMYHQRKPRVTPQSSETASSTNPNQTSSARS